MRFLKQTYNLVLIFILEKYVGLPLNAYLLELLDDRLISPLNRRRRGPL